ncbi:hypothetical protein MOK15_17580 [Sphingobium sp. BYY-5]|nr:hypothetical protein [Sphingobium sp. BYY-5]MCI4591898.1 hypothetical protein [Sphingobium sp. BYY-5]
MSLLRSWGQRWNQLRNAARREFLRDPNVVLFERGPEQAATLTHEGRGGR